MPGLGVEGDASRFIGEANEVEGDWRLDRPLKPPGLDIDWLSDSLSSSGDFSSWSSIEPHEPISSEPWLSRSRLSSNASL